MFERIGAWFKGKKDQPTESSSPEAQEQVPAWAEQELLQDNVSEQQQNSHRADRPLDRGPQEFSEIALEQVGASEFTDQTVDFLAEQPQVLQNLAQEAGPEAAAQAARVQQELHTTQGKSKWKQFIGDQLESRGGIMSAAGSFLSGAAYRKSLTALRVSGPYGWIAAVGVGGLVEGGRQFYEQLYKRADAGEILTQVRTEWGKVPPDLSKMAGLVAKADQLHKNAYLNGNEEQLQEVDSVVRDARFFLNCEISNSAFVDAGAKDTVLKLLELRNSSGADLAYSTNKKANEIIKNINTAFTRRGKISDVNKWAVVKGGLRGLALGAAGVAFGTLLHEGVTYAQGVDLVHQAAVEKAQSLPEKVAHIKAVAKEGLEKLIENGHKVAAVVRPNDGYDKVARHMIHDVLANEMSLEGKQDISTEKLVAMERVLSDTLQAANIDPETHVAKVLHPKDVLEFNYAKVQEIVHQGLNLDQAREASLHRLLETPGHVLSQKSLVEMHDFDTFINPDVNSLGVNEAIAAVQQEAGQLLPETTEALQTEQRWNSAWEFLGAGLVVAGAGAGAVAVERRAQEKKRTGSRRTSIGQNAQPAVATASVVGSSPNLANQAESVPLSNEAGSANLADIAPFSYTEGLGTQEMSKTELSVEQRERLNLLIEDYKVFAQELQQKYGIIISANRGDETYGVEETSRLAFYEEVNVYLGRVHQLLGQGELQGLYDGAISFGPNEDQGSYLRVLENGKNTKFTPRDDVLRLDPLGLADVERMLEITRYYAAGRLSTVAETRAADNETKSQNLPPISETKSQEFPPVSATSPMDIPPVNPTSRIDQSYEINQDDVETLPLPGNDNVKREARQTTFFNEDLNTQAFETGEFVLSDDSESARDSRVELGEGQKFKKYLESVFLRVSAMDRMLDDNGSYSTDYAELGQAMERVIKKALENLGGIELLKHYTLVLARNDEMTAAGIDAPVDVNTARHTISVNVDKMRKSVLRQALEFVIHEEHGRGLADTEPLPKVLPGLNSAPEVVDAPDPESMNRVRLDLSKKLDDSFLHVEGLESLKTEQQLLAFRRKILGGLRKIKKSDRIKFQNYMLIVDARPGAALQVKEDVKTLVLPAENLDEARLLGELRFIIAHESQPDLEVRYSSESLRDILKLSRDKFGESKRGKGKKISEEEKQWKLDNAELTDLLKKQDKNGGLNAVDNASVKSLIERINTYLAK